ncbi:MAG: peptidoglycan bridge formation glycyltransferase FemA/FemB family protein [Chloroflexi bacterium]|nr:MAG: peptidoglycan bridge formation glycyltransferase FemA/FemB family protein [Chloroflexota bacterium]MBL1195302.1 peptidoglycan bridge formation glycyltransferase FemA/FemB family protein [Chloroflexota bacterium]NOH12586.1 peptidoglycan bridge formation glycyltransferase FemA/FemB family protein [Chloroflexota bacterium]
MDSQTWTAIISDLPNPHLLQTWQWGEAKSQYGWTPYYKTWQDDEGKVVAAAQILQRSIKLPLIPVTLKMLYVPKGPLLNWEDAQLCQRVLADLKTFAKEHNAFFIKIDPDVRLGTGVPDEEGSLEHGLGQEITSELKSSGWRFSNEQVQYRNTVMVDLTPDEDQLLANMKQKTRYNVRLAGRKGVTVRVGTVGDFDMLYNMYAETANRDSFTIRAKDYYLTVWNTFMDAGMLQPLIAEVEGQPVAGLMLFIFEQIAWYIYGMSTAAHRNKMPTYLLQWEAIKAAKAAGCTTYDLWGAPDNFTESDSMWGVFRFKRGLGGQVMRHIGAWDLPVRPWLYTIYTQALPRLLSLMRLRAKTQTSNQSGDM